MATDAIVGLVEQCLECNTRATADHGPWSPCGMQRQTTRGPDRGKLPHSEHRTRIRELKDLSPGDHIAFHRNYLLWHHAIVIDVNSPHNEVTVIQYNGARTKVNGHFYSVRMETEKIFPLREEVYRYDYDGLCKVYEEVVDRALSRLGEVQYNMWSNNCEHFARWCKVGEAKCFQLGAIKQRLVTVGIGSLVKPAEEGFIGAVRCLLFDEIPKDIFIVGKQGLSYLTAVKDRATDMFGLGARNVGGSMKLATKAGSVAVNFVIEGINFGNDVYQQWKKYKNKDISKDDFKQQIAKSGCECLGGAVGATAGGLLLQLLFPIPFLGGIIGGFLGNVAGRLIGGLIGKQLHKVK